MLAYVLNFSRQELLINLDITLGCIAQLPDKQYQHFKLSNSYNIIKKFQKLINKRLEGYSVAAIIGRKFFWKSEFIVNSHTFIPRPDTEILIEAVLQEFPCKREALRILELGTGSGCIIISLLLEYKNAFGFGFEKNFFSFLATKENAKFASIISSDYREAAEANNNIIKINNNTNNIKNRLSMFFNDFARAPEILTRTAGDKAKIELIVSNPPYIRRAAIRDLQIEIQKEPKLALDGAFNGILPYISIFKVAQKLLIKRGKIFVEIGDNQEIAIAKLGQSFNFTLYKKFKDLTGKIRILAFCRF